MDLKNRNRVQCKNIFGALADIWTYQHSFWCSFDLNSVRMMTMMKMRQICPSTIWMLVRKRKGVAPAPRGHHLARPVQVPGLGPGKRVQVKGNSRQMSVSAQIFIQISSRNSVLMFNFFLFPSLPHFFDWHDSIKLDGHYCSIYL